MMYGYHNTYDNAYANVHAYRHISFDYKENEIQIIMVRNLCTSMGFLLVHIVALYTMLLQKCDYGW